ncbi:MAG: type II CRISPR RNA-guided endonuclease Cas9 [Sphingomonadales bacterium]
MIKRIALDLGANSLGFAVLELNRLGQPKQILQIGSRIFPDGRNPKDKTSLAVARRTARQMRRRRDRYLRRRKRLMVALVKHGLMPGGEAARKGLETLDPYRLRARGLNEALPLHHFGRALFHLNQRRGFKSNRKVDGDNGETGKVKPAVAKLEAAIQAAGKETLGAFLDWRRGQTDEDGHPLSTRARLEGEGARAEYELYPHRSMLMAEFDKLWAAQQRFHGDKLSDEARDEIRHIIFHQRPLKPVKAGKCTLNPEEERAPWALPLAQRFRIFQELNHLQIKRLGGKGVPLTRDQRDLVAREMLGKGRQKLSFNGISRLLKLSGQFEFNLESEKRKDLLCDQTAYRLSRDKFFGPAWLEMSVEEQTEIVEFLLDEPDEAKTIHWLVETRGLDDDRAERIANASLPDSHCRLGRGALVNIVEALEDEVIVYADAVQVAGYDHHSDFRTGEIFDELPYYGVPLERHVAFGTGEPEDNQETRLGKIANPTVHIGLNQVRKVVNEIIARYGPPDEIVIEVARDLKNSRKKREDLQKQQKVNQDKNDQRRKDLADLEETDNGENRLRLRLWEELNPADPADRRCPYTGEQISINRLFSAEVEIDHILPFSRTLDNSAANKTISLRRANRVKRNRTPYEAFGDSPDGFNWNDMEARSAGFPKNKRWRFEKTAMERFEVERDFLDRHLQDTQYLSRLCREYLSCVCDPNRVYVIPGRMTAMLRGLWGLNSLLSDHNRKDRSDQRHHAIDAAVIAVTDRSLLQRIATAAGKAELEEGGHLFADIPKPWESFREDLGRALARTVVAYKPDHGTQSRLHNDTAYGIVSAPDAKGKTEVVTRKPLSSFTKMTDIEAIRDQVIREELAEEVFGLSGKDFKAAVANYSKRTGTRRVRVTETLKVIPIRDKNGKTFKAYKGDSNHRIEIFQLSTGKWKAEAISSFDANRKGFTPAWRADHADARPVMTLHKDDMVALEHDGATRIMRVVKFSGNQIYFAEHFEGGNLKARDAAPDYQDPFKYLTRSAGALQALAARKVFVDPIGQVKDPGPPPGP